MVNKKPRAYTEEEVREKFLNQIRSLITYWNGESGSNVPKEHTSRERMEGLVHSILVMFDGGSGMMPAFNISVVSTDDDMEFFKEQGENWYVDGQVINDCQLHEEFFARKD